MNINLFPSRAAPFPHLTSTTPTVTGHPQFPIWKPANGVRILHSLLYVCRSCQVVEVVEEEALWIDYDNSTVDRNTQGRKSACNGNNSPEQVLGQPPRRRRQIIRRRRNGCCGYTLSSFTHFIDLRGRRSRSSRRIWKGRGYRSI